MHLDNGFLPVSVCPYTNLMHNTAMLWLYLEGIQDQNILTFADTRSMFAIRSETIQVFIDDKNVNQFYATMSLWSHVATIQDVSGSKMYVNGDLLAQTVFFSSSTIGHSCGFGLESLPMTARIDDVMFFNRTQSASEILLYKKT